ncbi:TRAP transporter substrate-binding protein [Phytopseudomonas daroniae]|uniref:TRAP transporter substrate-binding protein n=1 Tax=Phytopseudomonas daroniae TaxID=2487519 RepID=UPI001038540C|nr:TRAP transporter substrate-binding protein [Pseudomonas daroniae]TBU71332.1 C4-dicarboxylate ABC transporter [Pseudomonas daroniae]
MKSTNLLRGAGLLPMITLSAVCLLASGHSWAERTLRVAHASSGDSLVNQAMTRFAAELEARSGGELKARVFPDGQLGDEGPIAESVGMGSIDIGLGGVVEPIDPRLNVVTLPFLFQDAANVYAFFDTDAGKEVLGFGHDHGYKVLAPLDSGFRQFVGSRKAIVTPADLAGMKVRTPPMPTILATMKQFGALAQSIPYGEVYTSLQSGVVDGAEPEARDYYDQKWYEPAGYLSIANYLWSANWWYMNLDTYESLEPAQRDALDAAVADVTAWYRGQLGAVTEQVIAELQTKGVKVNQVDTAPFGAMAGPVYDTFAREWGDELIQHVRSAAAASAQP